MSRNNEGPYVKESPNQSKRSTNAHKAELSVDVDSWLVWSKPEEIIRRRGPANTVAAALPPGVRKGSAFPSCVNKNQGGCASGDKRGVASFKDNSATVRRTLTAHQAAEPRSSSSAEDETNSRRRNEGFESTQSKAQLVSRLSWDLRSLPVSSSTVLSSFPGRRSRKPPQRRLL